MVIFCFKTNCWFVVLWMIANVFLFGPVLPISKLCGLLGCQMMVAPNESLKLKKRKSPPLNFCTVKVSNNDCSLSLLVIKNYMTLRFCIISTILLIGTGIRVFVSSSIASASRAWAWCLLLYYVNKPKLPLLLRILGRCWVQTPE